MHNSAAQDGPPWTELPDHRAWLRAHLAHLLDFAEAAALPDGGFAWLDDAGRPQRDRPVEAWITGRMTHCFALGHLAGRPGCGPLVDVGLAGLRGVLHDDEHGGWFASATPEGPDLADKRAYEHAFVVLAASSATAAGRPGAAELLEEALDVMERRFWDEREGLLVDVWDRPWQTLEPYRGINANMHGVEAFLAAADVTGVRVWRERALRMCRRAVHDWGRSHTWRLPEHFDEQWQELPDYNRDEPAHPFRPYGATIGHGLEWARLCLHLRAALQGPGGQDAPDGSDTGWLLDGAAALFDASVRDGWAVDGHEGFLYTIDPGGAPVVRTRLHWVVTEAIGAAAALREATGDPRYDAWYTRWWDYAATHLIDRSQGSWRHELDPENRPADTVWKGKPDVYHALQATLVPRLPLAPSFAVALAGGRARW